jgi:hypothetical protein
VKDQAALGKLNPGTKLEVQTGLWVILVDERGLGGNAHCSTQWLKHGLDHQRPEVNLSFPGYFLCSLRQGTYWLKLLTCEIRVISSSDFENGYDGLSAISTTGRYSRSGDALLLFLFIITTIGFLVLMDQS